MIYRITYLNGLTGERQNYMEAGFESEQLAQAELDRILRQKERDSKLYPPSQLKTCIENNIYIPSAIIGSDWKIEPINIKYSLINVSIERGHFVSGYWMQDFIGELEQARERATELEKANGNKIKVAVVMAVNTTTPGLSYFSLLRKL